MHNATIIIIIAIYMVPERGYYTMRVHHEQLGAFGRP